MSPGTVPSAPSSASSPVPAVWGDVIPHSHLLQFYENEGFLIDSLSRLITPGSGGAVSSKLVCLSK